MCVFAGRVKNVASALKAVKAGPHGEDSQACCSSSSTLFLAAVQLTMLVLCRQDWHVCYQLPRVDACLASMQPEHPLLWYGNFTSSLKTSVHANPADVERSTTSKFLAVLYSTTAATCSVCTYAVPLYDSLGESSVEFIIEHSEASIVFTSTQKFPLLEKTLHKTKKYIKTIVYFGDVTEDSKRTSQAAEKEVTMHDMKS